MQLTVRAILGISCAGIMTACPCRFGPEAAFDGLWKVTVTFDEPVASPNTPPSNPEFVTEFGDQYFGFDPCGNFICGGPLFVWQFPAHEDFEDARTASDGMGQNLMIRHSRYTADGAAATIADPFLNVECDVSAGGGTLFCTLELDGPDRLTGTFSSTFFVTEDGTPASGTLVAAREAR